MDEINEQELLANAFRRLMRSKVIREVYAGRRSPESLDKYLNSLRNDCKTLKKQLQAERAENVRMRRLYGFLLDSKEENK